MYVFLQATIAKLLDLLVDDRQSIDDPNFVQDFLLTYRTFLTDPTLISDKLLNVFNENTNFNACEHIARVILCWVNNHYTDFESNGKLGDFLEMFDGHLQNHETEVLLTDNIDCNI
jgi:Rap guanine nucleotide exchange factor 2